MRTIALLGVGAWIIASVAMAHAVTPQEKCQQSKLKAQGKLQSCLKKNTAGIVGGETDDSAKCRTKFSNALAKADQKAADAGTSCRYYDNGDGTVSDLNTGLVWEKKDDLGGVHDKDNPYSWSTGSPYDPNGTAFTTFLYGLNGGTSSDGTDIVTACFTGHCDWRLPTIQELAAIVDPSATGCGSGSPCIDPAFGPTGNLYWSATTYSSSSGNAWFVLFGFGGDTLNVDKTNLASVRAVRSGL